MRQAKRLMITTNGGKLMRPKTLAFTLFILLVAAFMLVLVVHVITPHAALGGASLKNPAPTLTSISPTSATAGSPKATLSLVGTNFVSTSVVNWNGTRLTTTYGSATALTATVPADNMATAGAFPVTVSNPTPGGGTTDPKTFTVNNPAPTLSSISPTSATAGSRKATLSLVGTNFVSTSVVNWNGTPLSTTYGSSKTLSATIPAADMTTGGAFPVTVSNPTPGGGASAPQTFTVNYPAPTVTDITPNAGVTGDTVRVTDLSGDNCYGTPTVQLQMTGQNSINATSVVLTGSTDIACSFDLTGAAPGSWDVYVKNQDGQGAMCSGCFTVKHAAPTVTSITPNSGVNNGAVSITNLAGANFYRAPDRPAEEDGEVQQREREGQHHRDARGRRLVNEDNVRLGPHRRGRR